MSCRSWSTRCRTSPDNPPKTPIACDCSHHHVRRPDRCRNAVIAVHIANLESRRHREEARPAQLDELIYHPYFPRPAPKTGLSPKEVATAEACFPNFPTFQIWNGQAETSWCLSISKFWNVEVWKGWESLENIFQTFQIILEVENAPKNFEIQLQARVFLVVVCPLLRRLLLLIHCSNIPTLPGTCCVCVVLLVADSDNYMYIFGVVQQYA